MDNIQDVEYQEIKPKIYYTIPQIAEIIGEEEKRTRYWGETYGNEVEVELIDGRRKYPEKSIEAFKEIKILIDEYNYSKPQVIKYFSEKRRRKGKQYSDYSNSTDLINTEDPLGMDMLATTLTLKMEERMNESLNNFLEKLIIYQEDYKNDLIAQIKTEIATDILSELRDENQNIINSVNSIEGEISTKLKDEIIEKLENNRTLKSIEENISKSSENNEKLISEIIKQKEESNNKLQDAIKESSKKEEERDEKLDKMNRDIERSLRIQEQIAELREMESKKKGFWNRLFK